MITNVFCVSPTESVVVVARLMVENHINRIPIMENDNVVGIVTRGDIIKAVAECG
jgi:CBS domain-containing protein